MIWSSVFNSERKCFSDDDDEDGDNDDLKLVNGFWYTYLLTDMLCI